MLLLLLINAKEEIKLLFILCPSNLGKFLWKSLEKRALLNPLKIDVSAPGCFAVQGLFVPVSSLAFLRMGRVADCFWVSSLHYSESLRCWL